jgi:translation initiation factor IF-2
MTPKQSNDKEYTWTFSDVRELDNRLLRIENKIDNNYLSFKDDVKEVIHGQDCGLNIDNFNDIQVGDIIEAYEEIEIKRKLTVN